MAARPDSTTAIAEFRGPVLAVRGDEDAIASARDQQDLVDFSLDAVSVTLEGVGHLAPLEAPREIAAAIIDFLTKVRGVSC
jgi:3-oxoadipate enol-lactonase/4-carboxymuconolactone decarboxylase